jgi:hypothetical protein
LYPNPADRAAPIELLDEIKGKSFRVDETTIMLTHAPAPAPPTSSHLGLESSRHHSFHPVPGMDITLPSPFLESTLPLDAQAVRLPHSNTTSAPMSVVSAEQPPSCLSSAVKKRRRLTNRQLAYEAAIGTHLTWADFGGLTSTRKLEDRVEHEL